MGGSSLAEFPKEVEEFLEAEEEPPIYFGWGSMCRKKNDELVRAAIGACIDLGKVFFFLHFFFFLSFSKYHLFF